MLVGADQGHSYLGELVLCIAPPSKVLDDAMQRLVCRAASRRAAHACSTASRQPHLGSLSLAGGSSRHAAFSTAAARDPHAVLGLSVGATEAEVKRAYYELAKQTHPDALGEDAGDASFLEVADAFAVLMEAAAARPQAGQAGPYGSRTGVRPAAGRTAAATAATRGGKPPTLGEILVARLHDEPSAASLVWGAPSHQDRLIWIDR
jgi:hypothetical protein